MRNRAFRPIAPILAVLLLTSGPVQAGPVPISDVVQVVGNYQNPPDLRLRSLTQTASTPVSQVKGSGPGSSVSDASASLLAGVAVSNPQRGVEIIDQGDVEGTICDCGEILIPVGGFPKWPLLFLAAIPLFFIDTGDDIETPTLTPKPPQTPELNPTPTPPPQTPVPVPEPASLLLFGSGLAAFATGLRRRNLKVKLARVDATKEA